MRWKRAAYPVLRTLAGRYCLIEVRSHYTNPSVVRECARREGSRHSWRVNLRGGGELTPPLEWGIFRMA
jgi:hypothetical protein